MLGKKSCLLHPHSPPNDTKNGGEDHGSWGQQACIQVLDLSSVTLTQDLS